jgi:hypothetical protein
MAMARRIFVERAVIEAFLSFCEQQGCRTREHTGLMSNGYQVQYQGHWMALLWNKSFKQFTADRRLSPLIQSFRLTT